MNKLVQIGGLIDTIEKNVATRQDVEELQRLMSGLPQAETMVTDHFFVPGMYCRRLFRKAGTVIVGKVHKAPHFFVCVQGEIIVLGNGQRKHLKPGDVIETMPGTKRITVALTDAIGMTIHKTDKTDLDEIEKELIEEDVSAMFDSHNQLKKSIIEMQSAFDVERFRQLTARIIAAEKPGFWSDWTKEQQQAYSSGDWRAFSVSRGYSPEEIEEYAQWQAMIEQARKIGINPYIYIHDLATEAAAKNIAKDSKGEIMKSSHIIVNGKRVQS